MNDYEYIIMQLVNDESSTDMEMAEYLSDTTKVDKSKITAIIKQYRNLCLINPLIDTQHMVRILKEVRNHGRQS